MIEGHLVILFNQCVLLRIAAQFDSKHYSRDDLTMAGELLAQKIGGYYLYFDEDDK